MNHEYLNTAISVAEKKTSYHIGTWAVVNKQVEHQGSLVHNPLHSSEISEYKIHHTRSKLLEYTRVMTKIIRNICGSA
jgi:hypothetical protein